ILLAGVAAIATTAVSAQFFSRDFRGNRFATVDDHDGKFHFCRLADGGNSRGRGGGLTDYPNADINMSIRLSELTRTNVSFSEGRAPNHLLVRPADDMLFGCPMVMLLSPGRAYF